MARVALITGASRGIGAATALVLAEHGFRVVVNHRASAPQADDVVATIAAQPAAKPWRLKPTSPCLTTSPPWSVKSISGGVGPTCSCTMR